MSLYNDDSQFARVQNGAIVEWPVLFMHIKNRNLPLQLFRQIHFNEKPSAKPYVYLDESIELVNGVPTVSYNERKFTLEEILQSIIVKASEATGVFVQPLVTEVDPIAFQLVSSLTRDEITFRLNEFAKTRWYDSIDTLVTYANDPDPKHKEEGLRGVELRSQCWVSIRDFETKVLTGVIPVPYLVNQIYSHIPELTWNDVV